MIREVITKNLLTRCMYVSQTWEQLNTYEQNNFDKAGHILRMSYER